jgi:short-subunit dehydrogenase
MTRILIVGATSMIAEYTARLWGSPSVEFVLVARDKAKLSAVASDLRIRTLAKTTEVITEFTDPKAVAKTVADAFNRPVDIALIAQGVLTRQRDAHDTKVILDSVLLNAASPAMFAESVATEFAKQGFGSLGIIGSIAGERGRGSLYTYGASKAFLEKFVEGLGNRFASTKVTVSIIKPGPVATPMISEETAAAKFTAKPETAAKLIVRGMAKGKRKIYVPRIWRLAALLIRALPNFIFDRITH